MKIFLDSADLAEVRRAVEAGLIEGMTTNPSLLAKAAGPTGDPREILAEICRLVPGPVSAEVVATEADGMVAEGRELARLAENVVVKVPLTLAGLRACRSLRAEGIRVNVTLCFSPTQALFAAKAGASYISPFVGRLDDVASDGLRLVRQIRLIYDTYGYETELLVASVRHPEHVVEAAMIGADAVTVPPKVLYQLLEHPLTEVGLKAFLDDWRSLPRERRELR